MNVADKARTAAMQFEAKKNSLGQAQSGDWKLSFTVSATDVPTGLLEAPMGTRYVVALVEVNDQEEPVEQKPAEDKHRLSRQAAMLCGGPNFWAFIQETRSLTWHNYAPEKQGTQGATFEERCAACVRKICKVQSRSEFDSDPAAARRWRELHGEYEAWKIT